jgi:serine/threonine-protein phosphatase 2A regulatory subunit B
VTESDVLTAITFNKSGEYLAVGDKGGRVIIFRYMDLKNSRYFDYRYFSEIQSHETEFDHLKSIELEEKINSLEFLHNTKESSLQLLSTNDRVIKLWKLDKRTHRETSKTQIVNGQIQMPQSRVTSSLNEGKTRMLYKNCHNYNINSLSCSSDGESFLSADDLRINLWNLENNIEAYNVVDLKPPNIEEVSEVITHVEFHPRRSDLFMFSSSKGYVC